MLDRWLQCITGVLLLSAATGNIDELSQDLIWKDGLCNIIKDTEYTGYNLRGAAYLGENLVTDSVNDCALQCLSDQECHAFTYIPASSTCLLKSNPTFGTEGKSVGFVSGTCVKTAITIPAGTPLPANPNQITGIEIENCNSITCGNLCRLNCGWRQDIFENLPVFEGASGCIAASSPTAWEHRYMGSCGAVQNDTHKTTMSSTLTSPDPNILCKLAGLMGWRFFRGKCYTYSGSKAAVSTYDVANEYCQTLAMGLPSGIANAAEMEVFAVLDDLQKSSGFKLHSAWVNARANHLSQRYAWNGGTGDSLHADDPRWQPGEPNADGELLCVSTTTRYGKRDRMTLNDANCNSERRTFCEALLPTTTSTTLTSSTSITSITSTSTSGTTDTTTSTSTYTSTTSISTASSSSTTVSTVSSSTVTSTTTKSPSPIPCEAFGLSGWTLYSNRCIRFFNTKMTFDSAENYCNHVSIGGHLSSVSGPEEGNVIKNIMSQAGLRKPKEAWLGGTNLNRNSYHWTDGTDFGNTLFEYYKEYLSPSFHPPWVDGEPTGANKVGNIPENCTSTSLDGFGPNQILKWNDAYCENSRPFFCTVFVRDAIVSPLWKRSTNGQSTLRSTASIDQQTTLNTHILDQCSDYLCGRLCIGHCGWSSKHNMCVLGGQTSEKELSQGVCNQSLTTATTPTRETSTITSTSMGSTTSLTATTYTGSTSTTVTSTSTVGPCGLSTDMRWIPYGSKCFMYIGERSLKRSQAEAREFCHMKDGELASVDSVLELEFLGKLQADAKLTLHAAWVGAVSDESKSFHWLDGSHFDMNNTIIWAPGEPSTHQQDACVSTLKREGKRDPVLLNDVIDCSDRRRFFCSIRGDTTTTTKWTSTTTSTSVTSTHTTISSKTTTTTFSTATDTSMTSSTSTLSTSTNTKTTATVPLTCDHLPSLEGWMRHQNSCYVFSGSVKRDFSGAQEYCATLHPQARLMRLISHETANFAGVLIDTGKGNPVPAWVGGSTTQEGDEFRWWDGARVNQTLFREGEPNGLFVGGAQQLCLIISDRSGFSEPIRMNDASCSTKARFICEVVLHTSSPTAAPISSSTTPSPSSQHSTKMSAVTTVLNMSQCNSISCAAECVGTCGWSTKKSQCVFGGRTTAKELRLNLCSNSESTTSCSSIRCAKQCHGDCGWSTKRNSCVVGGRTRNEELSEGDCPSESACSRILCSDDCKGVCGWSSKQDRCKAGARTTAVESGLGTCKSKYTDCHDFQPHGMEWRDSDEDQNTCEDYKQLNMCGLPGNANLSWMGLSADQACCTCGGGLHS